MFFAPECDPESFYGDQSSSYPRLTGKLDTTDDVEEEVYLKAYDSVAQARQGIGDWLAFYNEELQHASLGRMTPDQVYYDLPSGLPIAA